MLIRTHNDKSVLSQEIMRWHFREKNVLERSLKASTYGSGIEWRFKRDFPKVQPEVYTKYFWIWMLLGAHTSSSTLIWRFVLEYVSFSNPRPYNKSSYCTDQDGLILQNIWDQFLALLSTFLSRLCNFISTN